MTKTKNIYRTQTEIGKLFGISSIKVGLVLKKNYLKNNKNKATKAAIKSGTAVKTPLKDGISYFMWNINVVLPLVAAVYKEIPVKQQLLNEKKRIIKQINNLEA